MSDRWVTVSEAARREGVAGRPVNKSSISRFLARNPDVPVERNDRGSVVKVDYEALAAARGASLSVVDAHAVRPQERPTNPRGGGVQPRNRKRELEEEKLELDLAERKGDVLDRAAVMLAVETAALTFTQALDRRRRGLAQQLDGVQDLRERELLIKVSDRSLLTGLAAALARAGSGELTEDEPSEAA